MLSSEDCRYIQAPALAALLPKLHLNRHTPRAVLFGSSNYGGMGIEDYFIDQGYHQLKFLIGHTKANDDVGQQIKVLLSYVQFLAGISKSVFTYKYQVFSGSTDHNLLSLIWDFCNKVGVTIDINSCRLHLNLLSLSDIMTAYSRTLLPEAIMGQPLYDRKSSLEWPHQFHPPSKSWTQWKIFLQYFTTMTNSLHH